MSLPNAIVELLPSAVGRATSEDRRDPYVYEVVTQPRDPYGGQAGYLIEMALATCVSPQTRRMYASQLKRFIESGRPLNREGVALYIQGLRDAGKGSSTMMSVVAAIRKLAQEARIRGLITADEYDQIATVSPGKAYKTRAGLWLTIEEVQGLLAKPDRSTFWGRRDACLLSVMIGCGLRRAEMAALTWDRYQSRDGRMCLVDVIGKGSKLRTLPVPLWAQPDVDAWRNSCRAEDPPLARHETCRPVNFRYMMGGATAETLYQAVCRYGTMAGHDLAPHDLRRTLAKMLRKSGAALEQIQYTLGHESIATTVLYLGSTLELGPGLAAVDLLKLTQNQVLPLETMDILTMHLEAERYQMEGDENA